MLQILFILFLFYVGICYSGNTLRRLDGKQDNNDQKRVYFLKRVAGPGCPYTASWLVHIDLFRRVTWYLDITKMEAATFNIYDRAKLKFQVSDPDAYYVHHMSMFEHVLHKKYGFDVAQNLTTIMSKAAVQGECTNLTVPKETNYIALIPFYGGLPPNVTKDLAVKSIGQGNSLVNATTKGLQTMATLCSCLKYFGKVVIGVARPEDKDIILDLISPLPKEFLDRINLIQFKMHKPSHLPFHLLAWGQSYVKHYNCFQFYDPTSPEKDIHKGFLIQKVDHSKLPQPNSSGDPTAEEYNICAKNALSHPKGTPIEVVFNWKDESKPSLFHPNTTFSPFPFKPIKYVYYTECDQIVKFDDMTTFQALSRATNETTFFTGRRREKHVDSNPANYMGDLNNWRECGNTGYSITWPTSHYVYHDA